MDRQVLGAQCLLLYNVAKESCKSVSHTEHLTTPNDKELETTHIQWSKVAGKKMATTFARLPMMEHRIGAMILAVVMVSNRYLTNMHLYYGHQARDERRPGEPTQLQIYLNPKRDPITFATCYLAAILSGKCRKLILVWRFRGARSVREWMSQYEEDAWLVFEAAAASTAVITRREKDHLAHLKIFAANDHEISPDERMENYILPFVRADRREYGDAITALYYDRVHEFGRARRPDLDGELHDLFVAEIVNGEMENLTEATSTARFNICSTERERALIRAAAEERHQHITYPRFAATSVNRNSRSTGLPEALNATQAALENQPPPKRRRIGALEDRIELPYERPQNPPLLHRMMWVQEQLAFDPHYQSFTEDSWIDWRRVWDDTDDSEKEMFRLAHRIQQQKKDTFTLTNQEVPSQSGASNAVHACIQDSVASETRHAGEMVPRDAGGSLPGQLVPRDAGALLPRDVGALVPIEAGCSRNVVSRFWKVQ